MSQLESGQKNANVELVRLVVLRIIFLAAGGGSFFLPDVCTVCTDKPVDSDSVRALIMVHGQSILQVFPQLIEYHYKFMWHVYRQF